MAARLEQLREPIVRGRGVTDTERHLVSLGERSFLNLWSYPNPYRDQKVSGKGIGKELCDLLVVCDPYVLIFSEKHIRWTDRPTEIAWSHWFKRAILKSAYQTAGAERWISEHPDRIFLDPACDRPLPIELPPPERRQVHRIVVARGAGEACRGYYNGGTGSLVVRPDIMGDRHWDRDKFEVEPFCIGDVDPSGSFVHVLDDGSLDFVMSELDTISDLTAYLEKKANFIRSGRLHVAHGEEDMVVYYATRINEDGDHDFVHPDGRPWGEGERLSVPPLAGSLLQNPQYLAKKEADKISYVWDALINEFTTHILNGTSVVPEGYEFHLRNSEKSIRHMALQNRFSRRGHGEAIVGALRIGHATDKRFFRSMIPREGSKGDDTGFFVLTFPYLDWMADRGGYDHYRMKRLEAATLYGQAMLIRHRYLHRIIGVAMEPPGRGKGSSEDLVYIEQSEWTDENIREIHQTCAELNIAQKFIERAYDGAEFPEAAPAVADEEPPPHLNRRQRRAWRADRRIRR